MFTGSDIRDPEIAAALDWMYEVCVAVSQISVMEPLYHEMVPGVGLSLWLEDLPAGGGGPTLVTACRIEQLHHNYLTVRRADAVGDVAGDPFVVAKPYHLRHDVAHYAWPVTLQAVDTNTVTVTDNVTAYRWIVTPIYRVGDYIWAMQTGFTDLQVNSDNIAWIEIAPSRIWGVEV